MKTTISTDPNESRVLLESDLPGFECVHRGKVRDLFRIDDDHLLMVTTDRLSAFDVILSDGIPGKGKTLTALTVFWLRHFERHFGLRHHLTDIRLEDVVSDPSLRQPLEGRALIVKRLDNLPIEAVVRGYLIGSGWKDYQRYGEVCGHRPPQGLALAERLPEPIFTPSTKAAVGDHDENIDIASVAERIGQDLADEVAETALKLYGAAAEHAHSRGIIIADTKFEFGIDGNQRLHLIDEVLTPDSSRFWDAAQYRPGISPPSFDKQIVRDHLASLDWDQRPPAPRLPPAIIERTQARYREALQRLTSASL
ncbi:MAG: phosphoribosylaminoimidazolesuccinocarboxamide synthase [Thioalkalivibrionaceae bacterium]